LELIKGIFWEEDVKHILSIPIKPGREDFLAWHFDDKGLFTVKSAYHVLADERANQHPRQHGESSNASSVCAGFPWLRIWKLPYIPKVKQFLWRLAHNSLPLRLNIKRRGVDADTRCPVCWQLDEDGGHYFFKCKLVKRCWRSLNLEDARLQLSSLSLAAEVVSTILNKKEEEKALIAHVLWGWWKARNKASAREQTPPPETVGAQAQEMTATLLFTMKQQSPRTEEVITKKRWQPPRVDVLKINTDGAFYAKEKRGAWGCVVRDSSGHGVLAGSGCLPAVTDALAAEGEACIAALMAAMDMGISQVIIETDSTNLVQALLSGSFDQAPSGAIFQELRLVLELHFVVKGIYHVPRSCNTCAHELARSGLDRDPGSPSMWVDPLPCFVRSLVDRHHADPLFSE
jgi:ribonuclease HI